MRKILLLLVLLLVYLYSASFEETKKLAEKGNADAQHSLGEMYYFGEGVSQNSGEAEKWYKKSAEQGNANAQYSLGVMYEKGEGVTKDNVKAYMFYKIATATANSAKDVFFDFGSAENSRTKIAKKMTPKQLKKAKELFKKNQKKYQKK